VQEIIAPMGISTKTVYKYFKGKEGLLEACLIKHYKGLKKNFDQYSKQNTNALTSLVNLFYGAIEEDFKAAPVFYHDLNYYYPELQDKILSKEMKLYADFLEYALNKSIADGFVRADVHPAIVLKTLGLLYRSLTRSNHFTQYDVSPFELASNTITVYLRGICTADGLAILDNLNQPTP